MRRPHLPPKLVRAASGPSCLPVAREPKKSWVRVQVTTTAERKDTRCLAAASPEAFAVCFWVTKMPLVARFRRRGNALPGYPTINKAHSSYFQGNQGQWLVSFYSSSIHRPWLRTEPSLCGGSCTEPDPSHIRTPMCDH